MRLGVKNALLHKLGFVQPPYFYNPWFRCIDLKTLLCCHAYRRARSDRVFGLPQAVRIRVINIRSSELNRTVTTADAVGLMSVSTCLRASVHPIMGLREPGEQSFICPIFGIRISLKSFSYLVVSAKNCLFNVSQNGLIVFLKFTEFNFGWGSTCPAL